MIHAALFGKLTRRIPLWFMRQAGRYLPEYRKIRSCFDDFIQFCYSPRQVTEVTLQPLHRFDVDAAIIFSDILVIPDALGQKVSFQENHGPVLAPYDLSRLMNKTEIQITAHLENVYEAIALTRSQLHGDKALFGFAGTPWTLACYMMEEGKSEHFSGVLNECTTEDFKILLDLLTRTVALHLKNQIQAGATVLQLFDSWAIKVPKGMEKEYLIDPFIRIAKEVHKDYPLIPLVYYGRCDKYVYIQMAEHMEKSSDGLLSCGEATPQRPPMGLGLWQGVSLSELRDSTNLPLQGNLDPELLLGGGEKMERAARIICESMQNRPFIFNLGHGVIKDTPPEHVARLVDVVRSF